MATTIQVKITLENADKFKLIKTEKGYTIEKTKEDIFDWYQKNYEGWYLQYPGYAMWTLENYKIVTLGVLESIKKVVSKNFEMPLRNVKDFCDIVNKERLAFKR